MDTEVWFCCYCHNSNNSTMNFCGSCGESRTSMDFYGTGDTASSEEFMCEGWACDKCTYNNAEHRRRCEICHAQRTTKIEFKHAEGWACDKCTYNNAEHRRRCEVCHAPRTTKIESKHAEDLRHETTYGIRENERRIVLIGKTGAGKSEYGNTILGVRRFESAMRGKSVTKKCKKGEALRFGKKLIVIDTPGLFDTGISNKQNTNEIIKCIGMTSPGPHAFVLVVQAGRFTEEENDTVEHFVQHFGDSMYNHLIVLFTRKDDIERSKQTIDDFVHSVPRDLQSILRRCNNRYVAFNNATENSCSKDQDAKRLLDMVETMLQENNGHFYTNEMYQEAEKALKRRMDILRNEDEQKREKEKRKWQQEITAKYESELDCIRQQSRDLEQKVRDKKDKSKSDKYQLEKFEKDLKKLEEQKNDEIEQMKRRMEEQKISNEGLRKQVRDESEKGSISHLVDGVKSIAKAITLPIRNFFS